MTTEKIAFANNLRGIAALMVVASHYLINFWTMRPAVSALTLSPEMSEKLMPTPLIATLLNFGHSYEWGSVGVGIFFIISGFVIPFSLKRHTPKAYIVGRIKRILPVYIFGFALTLIAIYLTTKFYSTNFNINLKDMVIHFMPGLRDIMQSRNIDGIVWTLEIEVKFYILCFFIRNLIKSSSLNVFWIPVLACLVSVLISLAAKYSPTPTFLMSAQIYLPYFSIMFMGVALHYLYLRRITNKTCILICSIYLWAFYFSIKMSIYQSISWTAVNYFYALVIFYACMKTNLLSGSNSLIKFMSNISYPFYVVHGVAGYCVMRMLADSGLSATSCIAITFFIAISVSYIMHITIEKRFMRKTTSEKPIYSN